MEGHWIFQLAKSFQLHYGPGVNSAASTWADNLIAICELII
jgi:hypothetical protein